MSERSKKERAHRTLFYLRSAETAVLGKTKTKKCLKRRLSTLIWHTDPKQNKSYVLDLFLFSPELLFLPSVGIFTLSPLLVEPSLSSFFLVKLPSKILQEVGQVAYVFK